MDPFHNAIRHPDTQWSPSRPQEHGDVRADLCRLREPCPWKGPIPVMLLVVRCAMQRRCNTLQVPLMDACSCLPDKQFRTVMAALQKECIPRPGRSSGLTGSHCLASPLAHAYHVANTCQ